MLRRFAKARNCAAFGRLPRAVFPRLSSQTVAGPTFLWGGLRDGSPGDGAISFNLHHATLTFCATQTYRCLRHIDHRWKSSCASGSSPASSGGDSLKSRAKEQRMRRGSMFRCECQSCSGFQPLTDRLIETFECNRPVRIAPMSSCADWRCLVGGPPAKSVQRVFHCLWHRLHVTRRSW